MSDTTEAVALGKNTPVFTKLEILRTEPKKGVHNVWEAKVKEFTCRCPVTGQPDYAKLKILIFPRHLGDGLLNVAFPETKTLKLYLETFRDRGIYHEMLVEEVAEFLHKELGGEYGVRVEAKFNRRGGISVKASVALGGKDS